MKEVSLRRLSIDDAAKVASLANNKKIWDNLRDYIPHPYEEGDARFFIDLTKKEEPHQTFGIVGDEELCGVISVIVQSDIYRLTGEIGYWLGEQYWGQGMATKAVGLITRYGFDELELERIHTGVFEHNTASMKALEKNGYRQEGVFRNSLIKNGKIYNEHRYAILKGA